MKAGYLPEEMGLITLCPFLISHGLLCAALHSLIVILIFS